MSNNKPDDDEELVNQLEDYIETLRDTIERFNIIKNPSLWEKEEVELL